MTASRPLRAVPAVLVALAATLAAAPAQDDCPPRSRAPQCVEPADDSEETTDTSGPKQPEPASTPSRGQAPTTPPGRETESTAEPDRADDPQPDRGADTPSTTPETAPRSDATPDRPSAPARPSRAADPQESRDTTPDPDDAAAEEPAVDEPVPPPPPDLGARRVLSTRLTRGPAGLSVAVDVEEARARGVDGGWTVTVTGAPGSDTAVDARSRHPEGPVGLIVGRVPRTLGTPPGFTVVGQRSTTVYDASYSGLLPLGPTPQGPPPVITVTLFQ